MRGPRLTSIVIPALVLPGTVLLLADLHRRLPSWMDVSIAAAAGAALLLVATGAAVLQSACIRRACRVLEHAARNHGAGKTARVESAAPAVQSLAAAINQCLAASEKALADALAQVRELELQLRIVTAERQHAQAIIYSISDAVLVTNNFDELLLANDAAARTLGFDLQQSRRRPLEQVLSDGTLVSLIREMRLSRSTNGRRIVEHTVKSVDGERNLKITLSCVPSSSGEAAGVVAVLHDMTREKEVARMKSDFVSHVSHELRTPVASIKAYVEMLVDGEAHDDKTRQEFYEVIQNESNRLSRLIDDILNISRIESGMVKINRQPTSLMVIIKQALEVIAPQAKAKRITLEEQLEPAFYQTIGDRDMLYQAVMNLLGNAIKYTPEGGRITVRTVADETNRRVSLRVSDTGVGIPAKDLPFVFDKFFRVDANNRMAKGTGLGLSLVKNIIENVHHGQVFVESTVGQGSTFGFTLALDG